MNAFAHPFPAPSGHTHGTSRDGDHRFIFDSPSKMKGEADKFLSVALGIVGKYPEVAGL
ncbi:MAG TPA: DUF269 domain-containing protein [Thiobacillaceae bacterium]|nr:DUF269 domain-containing protein [Thiobacillaceae bacterium]